ncbi:MAG TPA: HIT family protein [Candidatus Binatia bacterium]|nr:HIT family protein [Candidatus Binatia bacterium]
MSCKLCDLLKEAPLYDDGEVTAVVSETPAAPGHLIVAPKTHHVILEQVPDWVMGKLFTVANKLSIALFEGLGAQGTNLLIQNGAAAGQGAPHVSVNIVPRQENDGLNLLWQPRQLSEEEMSTVELKLKQEIKSIGSFDKEKPKPKEEPKPDVKKEYKLSEEENYLIKSLRRIP